MGLFRYYRQLDAMDCGPTCLRMVARYYGRHYNTDGIKEVAGYNKEGVSLLGISLAAEKLGFQTESVQLNYEQLTKNVKLPCILHWDQCHFVVMVSTKRSLFRLGERLVIADPAKGIIAYTRDELLQHWAGKATENGEKVGIALLLEPTQDFFQLQGESPRKLDWGLVFRYMRQSRWRIVLVFILLLIGSLLSLLFPFLTQSLVDRGINAQNLQYVTIVLVAQLMLIFSRTVVDFIRTKLLMNISIIINLSILSDFWIKLTRLPIAYFDSHHTGDTIQRLGDNRKIESFLTGNALSTVLSLFNFVIYGIVLFMYNSVLFLVFSVGSVLYFLWIQMFLRIRRKINYETFHLAAKENNASLQLVQGMQELKLNNAENLKRWEWEKIQVGIFRLNFKSLNYSQFQQGGALLINQGKDILITFLVAQLVIEGKLTFGAMLAVQYILGQLSGPLEQFVSFIQSAQDAKISMERLNQIHDMKDEEDINATYISHLPMNKSIYLKTFSFAYPGAGNEPVLKDITIEIPQGKVTAIVGMSGSGKTTFLKILLRFYELYGGEIRIGDVNLKEISPSYWRGQCGAVLQDGLIFNDTIARNIALGSGSVFDSKLIECCMTANILSFIESLPNGFFTKLGAEGVGISHGQRQRLLIARAIYRNPEYLFLDEATNALDTNTEKAIVENLQDFFSGKTVVIVAHRLSTVKNADKIIVLHEGRIAEEGTHEQLSRSKGKYFELVKNQLELRN